MINLYDRSQDLELRGNKRQTAQVRLIFIITASPVLAAAVADYFRGIDGELSVIWLTSSDRARNRLGLDRAARIVLDDVGPSTQEDVRMLKAAAPEATIMLLAGGRDTEAYEGQTPGAAPHQIHSTGAETEVHANHEPSALLRFHRSADNQALAGHLNGLG